MIAKNVSRFCSDDISLIENYEAALNDQTQTWHLHHRLELTLNGEFAHTKADLIRLEMYYNRPANELIFLTPSEHMKLHNTPKGRKPSLISEKEIDERKEQTIKNRIRKKDKSTDRIAKEIQRTRDKWKKSTWNICRRDEKLKFLIENT